MKTLGFAALAVVVVASSPFCGAQPLKKPFPKHWGNPPAIQTRDIRELPDGYGQGSSTLAKWIQQNTEKDKTAAKPKPPAATPPAAPKPK